MMSLQGEGRHMGIGESFPLFRLPSRKIDQVWTRISPDQTCRTISLRLFFQCRTSYLTPCVTCIPRLYLRCTQDFGDDRGEIAVRQAF
jgi:hypothetical protein